jgi:hypothetical protein
MCRILRNRSEIFKAEQFLHVFGGNAPVLIQAFYARESIDAIPADQIILYSEKEVPVLMLPKGNFRIRPKDKTGNILQQYEKN